LTVIKEHEIILVKLYKINLINKLLSRAGGGISPRKPGNRLILGTVLILTAEMLEDKKLFFKNLFLLEEVF
jgi:hypothetical protein